MFSQPQTSGYLYNSNLDNPGLSPTTKVQMQGRYPQPWRLTNSKFLYGLQVQASGTINFNNILFFRNL